MRIDAAVFEQLLKGYLSRNRGPGYGIAVDAVASDSSTIVATVSFVDGKSYCCAEPFCHLPRNLTKFTSFAAARGVTLPTPFKIHWHIVIEEGATFTVNASFGAPLASSHREYDIVSTRE